MKKYIAQVIIEATSPLVVGSGKSGLDNDAVVTRDFNFLPYIPGTGITGIISSLFEEKFGEVEKKKIFGGEDEEYRNNEKETFKGSDFEISDALLVDDGKVLQHTVSTDQLSEFHKKFLILPKREHVRIDHRGVAEEHGKFDNEFVYKGARFKFEIEMMAEDDTYWNYILNSFYSSDFLLGSGTTNGYGQTEIVSLKTKTYDLSQSEGLISYLSHTVDLNIDFDGVEFDKERYKGKWKNVYSLELKTQAIHIGSGYGDGDVDDANYKEYAIVWGAENKPVWEQYFVIPGSSVKGTIAHRLAYHKNIKDENYTEKMVAKYLNNAIKIEIEKTDDFFKLYEKDIDNIMNSPIKLEEKIGKLDDLKKKVSDFDYKVNNSEVNIFDKIIGEHNKAVKELFGCASNENNDSGNIGTIIIDDFYIPVDKVSETIFDHNSIDRYTGGTIDSALFSEKVFTPYIPIKINIKVSNEESPNMNLFQSTIKDLAVGELAIGGKTNKGYGFLYETIKEQKS